MEDGFSSFWGPVTSTDRCEKNYVHSSYIAEFFNTISSIPGILFALIGLINALRQRFEKRFSVLHISNMILSIGSMLYHATLQRVQQQGDETPMVWEMLLYFYILYSPDWHYRSTMPTFLFFYGVGFAIAHALIRFEIGFKVHYIEKYRGGEFWFLRVSFFVFNFLESQSYINEFFFPGQESGLRIMDVLVD
ncbi:hypothetical protein GOBAR_AA38612 [Gossypium barbadense]|uniref:Alkaline ceramidase n=1 Tax=Gossypium barbadense TaxID=3634 RepID=A0A2P5VTE3_GOSBA|nr:hypothetical protein GOBAR_AA38612 [Gossypium barbadense]